MTRMLFPSVLLLGAAVMAQTAPDPSGRGNLPVTNVDYKIERVLVPSIAYPVDVWATVWHPTNLPGGPYPLVLILHGNHGICRTPGTLNDVCTATPPICPAGFIQTPQEKGYNYFAEKLASHGYIVASINANSINCRANAIPERGRLVQEHLRRWSQWNTGAGAEPFGGRFAGKVNLQNVGLIGHSRGGEGVRAAYNMNRDENSPFGIKAVIEISPVDFGRGLANPLYNVDDVHFGLVLSACDADVSDNQGIRALDRSLFLQEKNPTTKVQKYVWGSNHNFFNSEWLPESTLFPCVDLPIMTTRPPQEAVGAVYLMGMIRAWLGNENFPGLLTGDLPPPPAVQVPVDTAYLESPSRTWTVENFTHAAAPRLNQAGAVNSWINLNIRSCNAGNCALAPVNWTHDVGTFVADVSWPQRPGATASLTIPLSSGGEGVDISQYRYISFRVAAKYSELNPTNPGTQNFTVQLSTESGSSNGVQTASYTNIPFPVGGLFRRSILKTVRIPLSSLGEFDRTKVTRIHLIFDQNPTGAIFLTDLQFVP